MYSSNASLFTTTKQASENTFDVANTLLLQPTKYVIAITEGAHFSRSYSHTKYEDHTLHGANVATILEVHKDIKVVGCLLVVQSSHEESEKYIKLFRS
jgi:hypothetical protein